ncbi:hypothetical protein HYV74_04565 [Candidatus Uhrbacteria bacterium]|nr:hypothetical protein [Candidatus Uhrbacteria bacterium]
MPIEYGRFIRSLLPTFIAAGEYALAVQSRIRSRDKEGVRNLFAAALTDADLSIQTLFEVTLLGERIPVRFAPEEAEHSLNLRYFPPDAEHVFWLDPVNGTRFYREGFPHFDVIGTLTHGPDIVAAVVYLPAFGRAYYAIAGEGAFTMLQSSLLGEESPLTTEQSQANRLFLEGCDPSTEQQLRAQFDVVTIEEYDRHPTPQWALSAHDMLTGNIAGVAKTNAPLIDWGAMAWIVEQAGGIVSTFTGGPIPSYLDFPEQKIPQLLVARDQETHERMLRALRG